ncbi:SDR family oxidoreductase [Beijerinckia indica]|uniref:Short-chain dehydrogenase/reductase SDR n=1 Tax=Beijerinckia indica subsp. indica (strain ATCC 9039 / DSM 1715 / NCIMB 8712) TaxID=395963 RepID=B2IFQ9_BEII9|nr:SDR family oxidoreductase [Beijerinckia indica]ACB94270.1 short-chain dehydrogenase/reductase SDR [Beijerinckia indica subsp. indica ATCC 9039]
MTMNDFSLKDRLALVTGSSQGIGFALAQGLAAAGARVILNGRDKVRLEAALQTFKAMGFKGIGLDFDVCDPVAVTDAIDQIEINHGAIDILVNNAGIQWRQPLEEFPPEKWTSVINTNLSSVFFVSQAVARHMIPRRKGVMINIGSVQSELGRPNIAPYAASKGGLKMLTKGMAIDWGKYGIRVNGIGPGYFKTELNKALTEDKTFSDWLTGRTPLKRWGNVEELAGAAVFLASDAASFITGHILYVDGGVTAQL